jgi:hypothetical protein
MTDSEFKVLGMLAKADGVNPDALTKAQFRKYYAELLVSKKIADHEAERIFQKWSAQT